MEEVVTTVDAMVLTPNKEHENFTDSGDIIESGTPLLGTSKTVQGKRRGKPFSYRLFFTNKNEIIYLNTVSPMRNATEVTLGADGQVSPTKINFRPEEVFSRVKTTGLVLGAIAGYFYAKKKGKTLKKSLPFIIGGGVVGYGVAYMVDKNRKVTVKPSK
jgi:DNA gyrase/topoisomerase IV subunit B